MARKSNARERILETAGKLFTERGYSEVGINEIIETAETAKATFYSHFPSKADLCEAWLDLTHERSECKRGEIIAAPGEPAEKIDNYFKALATYMEVGGFRGCPYSNTGAVLSEPKHCGIREQIECHKVSIRDFFKALALGVTGDEDSALALANALFVLYSGAASEAQNLRELWPVHAARETAVSLCELKKSK